MKTILLVDDDDLIRSFFHNYLEAYGYNLLEAPDGAEALLIAELFDGTIDYLVTDLIMPRLGGFELARRIQLIRPEIRTIFMSGYSEEAAKADRLSERPKILMKPFSPRALLNAIEGDSGAQSTRDGDPAAATERSARRI